MSSDQLVRTFLSRRETKLKAVGTLQESPPQSRLSTDWKHDRSRWKTNYKSEHKNDKYGIMTMLSGNVSGHVGSVDLALTASAAF